MIGRCPRRPTRPPRATTPPARRFPVVGRRRSFGTIPRRWYTPYALRRRARDAARG